MDDLLVGFLPSTSHPQKRYLIILEPPTKPLYPEPQPIGQGRYLLDPKTYHNLPWNFEAIDSDETIVVHSTGALKPTKLEDLYYHASQWTHYNGRGRYTDDFWYDADPAAFFPDTGSDAEPKVQGRGRRWAYLPWTEEQEVSCRPIKIYINLTNPNAKETGGAGREVRDVRGDSRVGAELEDSDEERDSGFHTGEEIDVDTEDEDMEDEGGDQDVEGEEYDEDMDDGDEGEDMDDGD